MDYKINNMERDALYGLPLLCQLIYFRALRPFMDFATGVVGRKRGISYQSLREECSVAAHQGYPAYTPTHRVVRRAIERLITSGILERQSGDKQLILKCCLATRDNSVQIKGGSKRADDLSSLQGISHTAAYDVQSVSSNQVGTTNVVNLGTPPETGKKNTSLSLSDARKTSIPRDYFPSATTIENAKIIHYKNATCPVELGRFIAFHTSKGTQSYDWDAEYFYWVLGNTRKQQGGNKHDRHHKPANTKSISAVDRVALANQYLFENNELHEAQDHQQERYRLVVDGDDSGVWPQICE